MVSDAYVESSAVGFGIGTWIFMLLFCVFVIVCQWKIFEKAGEPGWAAIIPFYNTYVLFKISFGNGLFFLTLLVPFVNFIFLIIMYFKLAKAFGYGVGFGFLLLFVNIVAMPILAFGNHEYVGVE